MKLVYTLDAVEDLVRLREFVAEKDASAASGIGAELAERIEKLRDFPELGHRVLTAPENLDLRDFIFGNYIVRYIPRDDVIIVLRIWHTFDDRGE